MAAHIFFRFGLFVFDRYFNSSLPLLVELDTGSKNEPVFHSGTGIFNRLTSRHVLLDLGCQDVSTLPRIMPLLLVFLRPLFLV